MGQQRRGPATTGAGSASEQSQRVTHDTGFEAGNEAARAALSFGGDDDDADRAALRSALTHSRLALQLTPSPPAELRRWLEILQHSGLPDDRREALLARLNTAQARALEVADAVATAAGEDTPAARALLSDAIGSALAAFDGGVTSRAESLAPLSRAFASVRFDEGDEEALFADQVAEEHP